MGITEAIGLLYLDSDDYCKLLNDLTKIMNDVNQARKNLQRCPTCGGEGLICGFFEEPETLSNEKCPKCKGKGWIETSIEIKDTYKSVWVTCPNAKCVRSFAIDDVPMERYRNTLRFKDGRIECDINCSYCQTPITLTYKFIPKFTEVK